MEKFKLKNGMTVVTENKTSESVAIFATIKVGSNYETKKTAGISHLIEHLLFEGTKNRTAQQISNTIESIGGEINAFTNHERTSYYIVVLKKYIDIALEILSDIIKNPKFDQKTIEKEKKVVIDETKLFKDDPKLHQWDLFLNNLFKKHPTRNPITGTINSIKNIKRNDILKYHKRYYSSNNIILSIAGNIKNIKPKVEKHFGKIEKIKQQKRIIPKEPGNIRTTKKEKRKISQSYLILGYKTPPRKNKECYALDVIRAILGRGQSSKLFEEIRTKRGLAYHLSVHHEPSTNYGYFVVSVATEKKNITKIINIITKEIEKLQNVSKKDLKDAINYIEGNYLIENEENKNMADMLSFWELIGDSNLTKTYIKEIKKITEKDIKNISKKYLNRNYTLTIIEQE